MSCQIKNQSREEKKKRFGEEEQPPDQRCRARVGVGGAQKKSRTSLGGSKLLAPA